MGLIFLNAKELKELRKKQFEKQKGICPILKQKINEKDGVFDHKHKTKNETLGEDGKGLLRGVVHNNANVVEGKIARLYKRYGLHKFISLPEFLRNLADYIENPPIEQKYVHPSEKPKIEKQKIHLKKYQSILRYYFNVYPRRNKLPKVIRGGINTKEFEKIIKDYDKWLEDSCFLIKKYFFDIYPRKRSLPAMPKNGIITKQFSKILNRFIEKRII